MEFEEQYLLYDEYQELGGTNQEMPFNLLEIKARTIIDKYTIGRVKEFTTIPEEVKACMYELIETMSTKGIYLDANCEEQKNIEKHIVYSYLSNIEIDNTPIIYLGI